MAESERSVQWVDLFFRIAFKLLLIIFISCSCQISNESKKLEKFGESDLPAKILLKGKKHNLEFLLNPAQLIIKDDRLIIAERKSNQSNKIHIVGLKDKQMIRQVGIDGMGPGEITMGYPLMDNGIAEEFWVYDGQQLKFSKFSLNDTSKLASKQFRGLEIPGYITEATFASEESLLVNLVDGWEKFFVVSLEMDTLSVFGNWKDMVADHQFPNGLKSKDLNANLVSDVFQGVLRGNTQKQIFIFAGTRVAFVEIIDLNKKSSEIFWGPDIEIPAFEITYSMGYQMAGFDVNKLKMRYMDGFVGNNSIFLLYSGKGYREISEKENLNRIFELDFSGNILSQFQLDYPLFGFTVDESSRVIYGLTTDADPNLVEFSY